MAAPRPGVFYWLLSYRPKPESGYSLLPLPRADSDTDAASCVHLTESELDDSEEMVQTYGDSVNVNVNMEKKPKRDIFSGRPVVNGIFITYSCSVLLNSKISVSIKR